MRALDPASDKQELRFDLSDGLTMVADARGNPEDPPVFLLHGGGQTRHAWGGTARELATAGFYTLSFDLRGHGDSDWDPDGDYMIETFSRDLVEMVDGMGVHPCVVGASLGGLTALLAEGEIRPGLLKAVVFVDITPRMTPEGTERIFKFMTAKPDGFVSLEEAADHVAAFMPHRPRPDDHSGLEKNLRLGEDGRYRWHWDPQFLNGRINRSYSEKERAAFLGRLNGAAASLSLPTMLIRGRMSDIVSEDAAREFLELVPHAEYVDVEDAAHMVAGDRNDIFTKAVKDFLVRAVPRLSVDRR